MPLRVRGLSAVCLVVLLAVLYLSIERESSEETNPPPAALHVDPLEIDGPWILSRLDLPAAVRGQLEANLNDSAKFEDQLRSFFYDQPPVRGLPEDFIRNRQDAADLFDRGLLQIRSFAPIPFEVPIDWADQRFPLTYLAELHSWRFVNDLLVAYQETGRPHYFDAMESVIIDWITANRFDDPAHSRAWHEGAVSKRTLVLLNLFDHYRQTDAETRVPLRAIIALVVQHAEFLAWGAHYRPAGNHGIRQDIALLAVSFALSSARRSDEWQKLAMRRLEDEQLQLGFSSEGVWREHSPGYHYYVIKLFGDLVYLIEQNEGEGVGTSFLTELIGKSQKYLTHVVTPTGKLPPVGDTFEKRLALTRSVDCPSVRYVLSGGERGAPPDALDGFFPDGGEVVFRDTWGDEHRAARDAFYIHMHAAFHPGFGHRHADDLSFVMFGHGRWWISEAGKYGFAENRWRDFALSAQAHNGYTFEGAALRALASEDPSKDAFFEASFVSTDDLAAARAHTTRFRQDGVEATRTFIFLRERHTLVLLDQLTSPESGTWQGYLHMPADMVLSRAGPASVIGVVESHPELILDIAWEHAKTQNIDIAIGREDPLLGWHSPKSLEMIPAPTIVLDRDGADLLVATIIRVHDRDAPTIQDVSSERNGSSYLVTWREGTDEHRISASVGEPLMVQRSVQ